MKTASQLDRSAARVALAVVWSAVVRSPAAFELPRFAWNDDMEPADVSAAVEHLAHLPKPLRLGASSQDDVVRLETAPSERQPRRSHYAHWLAELAHEGGSDRALLLSGGRALRVNLETLERLDADYRLDVPASGGGGPLDDPWTQQLGLPPLWMQGMSIVFLLGCQDGSSMRALMRPRGMWIEEQIEDLTE